MTTLPRGHAEATSYHSSLQCAFWQSKGKGKSFTFKNLITCLMVYIINAWAERKFK